MNKKYSHYAKFRVKYGDLFSNYITGVTKKA